MATASPQHKFEATSKHGPGFQEVHNFSETIEDVFSFQSCGLELCAFDLNHVVKPCKVQVHATVSWKAPASWLMTAMLSILFGSKDPWGQRQAFKAHYQAPASGEKLERLNGTESTDLSAE